MADDLSIFIESQKRKLEQERSEILRAQQTEDRSRTSPRGYKLDSRHAQGGPFPASEPKIKAKATIEDDSDVGGLKLGGYEKHQQKLRQERKEEYRKYLAEKNFRSSGKAGPGLSESRSPYPGYKSGEAQARRDENSDGDYSFHSERRGKENYDDSARDYDSQDRRGTRKPENLFESYEELLQRKRAQEKRYRGFDDPDSRADRPMRLNAPQYKQQSRSDGYLSRRFDDEDYDGFSRNRPRGQREKSFESKRVRFHGDDDLDDDSWVKPRRRLDYYDNDEEEEDDDLSEWVRKRGKRPQRRNSAHLPDREPPQEETLQRSKTDTSIRSQSAPLEGTGIIGGSEESRSEKTRKQEQYKKELQQQMQEQADIKKREKMLHLGVEQNSGRPLNSQLDRTPPDANRRSHPPQSQGYDMPLANHGPNSRPPPHPAIHSNPYDDPYYYYGALEMGALQGPSVGGPMDASRGTGQQSIPGLKLEAGISGGAQLQNRETNLSRNQGYTTPAPGSFLQQGGGELSPHSGLQPPGGFSSIGAEGADPASAERKKAAQQAYQEELKRQMQERNEKKQKEKEEKERYDRKIEQEAANYNPWGKGGGGAPLRDSTGHLVANLRTLKQNNDQGINVSPREQPPPVETRFEITADQPYLSPRQGANIQSSPMQAAVDSSASGNRTTFGRSDPLKEAQPQDDLKKAARQEYQEYLRKQVEEKEKMKKEELKRTKREEEELEKRIEEERIKMQKDFEQEQEKSRRKEEEARLKNEAIKEAQEAKKREADKKKKEMEEQRQTELKRKLDAEMAAKRAATSQGSLTQTRTNSPPIPAVQKKMEEAGQDMTDFRFNSPPIPTLANKQTSQGPVAASPGPSPPVHPLREPEPVRRGTADRDVLSQLTTLRQQLKNEEKRVQQQMDRSTAVANYSQMQRAPEDLGSRRGRRDVQVFERALANKMTVVKKDSEGSSAADEFNRMKYEETSSLAEEFRSKFPDPVSTSSVLDLQQQAFLMEQEDKLAALRSDPNRHNKQSPRGGQPYQVSRRPGSRDSLLESESQFLVVDDPKQMLPIEQMSSRPRQSSARERRRWKQLEELARNPRPHDTYKPPTPGGFSLNSVTSFNVDEVANRNEERLRRLELIQRGGGQGGRGSLQGDPDQVLQRFMDERSRPANLASRLSETSLEAETSFEPL